MPFRHRIALLSLLSLALVLGTIAAADATSVKLVNDFRLVDQARLVVVARVVGTLPSPEVDRPVTDYLMNVERVLKGSVGESSLLVRVPGGRAANGMELKIWGAPTFDEGERALLFLGRHADGSYRILHLMLGAFREARMAGHAVAYRDLSEVDVLDDAETLANETRKVRDFDRFADWIADRAASRLLVPNYYLFLPAASQNSLLPMFTLLGDNGRNARWFEFDNGGQVTWRIDPDAFPGFGGSTSDIFRNAMAAWNAESHTPIRSAWRHLRPDRRFLPPSTARTSCCSTIRTTTSKATSAARPAARWRSAGPGSTPIPPAASTARPSSASRAATSSSTTASPASSSAPPIRRRPPRSSSGTRPATPSGSGTRARTPARPTRRCATP